MVRFRGFQPGFPTALKPAIPPVKTFIFFCLLIDWRAPSVFRPVPVTQDSLQRGNHSMGGHKTFPQPP